MFINGRWINKCLSIGEWINKCIPTQMFHKHYFRKQMEYSPAKPETWVPSDPWVGKIPWRRERLPTPVFWPGEFHGLYRPWGDKGSDTESLSLHFIHTLDTGRWFPMAPLCFHTSYEQRHWRFCSWQSSLKNTCITDTLGKYSFSIWNRGQVFLESSMMKIMSPSGNKVWADFLAASYWRLRIFKLRVPQLWVKIYYVWTFRLFLPVWVYWGIIYMQQNHIWSGTSMNPRQPNLFACK